MASSRLHSLGRFGLRALRITASTASLVELLRSDWFGGAAAAAAWLLFVQVERRWPPADSRGHGEQQLEQAQAD